MQSYTPVAFADRTLVFLKNEEWDAGLRSTVSDFEIRSRLPVLVTYLLQSMGQRQTSRAYNVSVSELLSPS